MVLRCRTISSRHRVERGQPSSSVFASSARRMCLSMFSEILAHMASNPLEKNGRSCRLTGRTRGCWSSPSAWQRSEILGRAVGEDADATTAGREPWRVSARAWGRRYTLVSHPVSAGCALPREVEATGSFPPALAITMPGWAR